MKWLIAVAALAALALAAPQMPHQRPSFADLNKFSRNELATNVWVVLAAGSNGRLFI